MKHTITNRLAVLLLLVLGVTGCTKEETLPGDTPDTARIPITISVTDGGYAASDKSAAQTRAVENGYATTFTAGDQIGLYVVKPDGSYIHENIALTLTDNGSGNGTLAWTPPAGTMLYHEDAAARYFAYYPYKPTWTGNDVNPLATDAAGFFADVVSKWTPTEDQSSYALYTASDLMVGSSTVSKQADGTCPLALTMTHAMALVVIETLATKYTFTNDSPAIPDYYNPAFDTQFYDFMPYSPTFGTYRYLVKPAQSGAPDLYGSYTGKNVIIKMYEIEQNGIATANYAHYKVDGGITSKTHNLQMGDYYMHDGSLLATTVTLTDAQKAKCIGIVLKVGRDGEESNYWKDDCNYMFKGRKNPMSTIHGYVLALHEGNNCEWGSDSTNVETNTEQYTGFYGYTNTNTIEAFATQNGNNFITAFPATYYATEGYEEKNPAPVATSGWFLPSAGQCKFWLDNNAVLLGSVRKATGSDDYNWKTYYWSSSERNGSPANHAWYLDFYSGDVSGGLKNDSRYVRSVLAF